MSRLGRVASPWAQGRHPRANPHGPVLGLGCVQLHGGYGYMLENPIASANANRDLSDLVGELSTQSAEFRTRWAAHNVRFHDTGTKDFHHPVVGDITLTYNRLELAADPGQMLMIWTAEPGSTSAEALSLLGSWGATPQQPEPQNAPDRP